MEDLAVGDYVLVAKNRYEPVYSFGHKEANEEAPFWRIFTNLTRTSPLELTDSHLIYKLGQGAVRADTIQPYDVLVHQSDQPAQVYRVERDVTRKGLYMPLTPSGTIVVDGLKASSYVSLTDWAPSVVKTVANFGFSDKNP